MRLHTKEWIFTRWQTPSISARSVTIRPKITCNQTFQSLSMMAHSMAKDRPSGRSTLLKIPTPGEIVEEG